MQPDIADASMPPRATTGTSHMQAFVMVACMLFSLFTYFELHFVSFSFPQLYRKPPGLLSPNLRYSPCLSLPKPKTCSPNHQHPENRIDLGLQVFGRGAEHGYGIGSTQGPALVMLFVEGATLAAQGPQQGHGAT